MNKISVREVSRSGNRQVIKLFQEADYIKVKLKNSVRGSNEVVLFGIYAIDYDDLTPDAVSISDFRISVCSLLSKIEEGESIQVKQTAKFPYNSDGSLKQLSAFMLLRLTSDEVEEALLYEV